MDHMKILGWILVLAVLAFILYRKRQLYTTKKTKEEPAEKEAPKKKEEPVKSEIEE